MIRINLLPVKEAERRKSSRQFLILSMIVLIAELLTLMIVYGEKDSEAKAIQVNNDRQRKELQKIENDDAHDMLDALEAEEAELMKKQTVLASLEESKSGPVKMLKHFANMLTPIDTPRAKINAQEKGWNPEWEPKRIWIDKFEEKNREVTVIGHARSNEDVAELLKRMNTSSFFAHVRLIRSEAVELQELQNATMYRFIFKGYGIYGRSDIELLARDELGPNAAKRKKKKKKK